MKYDKVHIWEIRDGDTVLERYRCKAPAETMRKDLRKAGRKVKLHSLFVRKYIPLERKVLPKRMEFWKGSCPWEIPPEAASQLQMGWEHINEVFYIGSYKHGQLCMPNDRTEDLSIQPDGDGLALCYHIIPEDRTYLILGRIDHINVTRFDTEIFGTLEDGSLMMVSMEIQGSRERRIPREIPFEKGWYALANGSLFYVDNNDEKALEDEHSEEIAGMFPYLVIYPGFSPGDYTVGKGLLPVKDKESLAQALERKMRASPVEHIATDWAGELAAAFRRRDTDRIKRIIEKHPGNGRFAPVVSGNRKRIRRMRIWMRRK